MEVQGLGQAGLQPNEEVTAQEMETTDQPTLPPHRTLSPGFSGDEVILDEVALITDKREEAALAGDSGNHSSEEELEEINTKKSQYVERDCKRKWTDLSQSDTSCDSDTEFEEPELGLELCASREERRTSTSGGSSSSQTPDNISGDEDHNHNQPAPVQFSTQPPLDVHKPRRSLSPPPKLFGFSQLGVVRQDTGRLANYSTSLGDLSRIESRVSCKKTISPR